MTQFAIPNTSSVSSLTFNQIVAIDISSLTGKGDYISLSLPEFPRTKVDVLQTFVDFTSNPKGDFSAGPVDQIAFSEANPSLPLKAGDTEMRIPLSLLINIDKSRLTGVRFRIFAQEECTFRCLSIRACSENWAYAPIDLDTLWHRVHRPPSPNGSTGTLRTNLFTNPSSETTRTFFESGSYKTSRVKAETEGITAISGEYITKSVFAENTDSNVGFVPFTFPEAGIYTVSTYVYFPNNWDGGSVQFNAEGYTGSSEINVASASSSVKGDWQRVVCQITVTGDLVGNLVLRAVPSFPTVSRFLFMDALLIEAGSTLNEYFDGSFLNAKWSGSANSSTSLLISNFPGAESKSWPIVFRSDSLTGFSDPTPVNMKVGVAITAGSLEKAEGSSKNEFALYFRDIPTDNQTQIEMNVMTQSQLETHSGQPDFGRALYDARDQTEIDVYDQTELDEKSQFNIERKPDESEHTWLEVRLKWGAEKSSNELTILDADDVGHTFTNFEIEKSKSSDLDAGVFWLVAELQDSNIRVRIYNLNQIGEVTSPVPIFDSGIISDDSLIKRRKGRFGWWANLLDGDAHIDNIKTRGVNYGEFVSKEFRSITPVKGVSLYTGSTSDHELVSGIEPTDRENTTLSLDPGASATGKAIKIEVAPLKPLQGIVTNPFLIDDPQNIRISFDIKFPSSETPGGSLSAFLIGSFEDIYPVNISSFKKDIWTHVKVSLKDLLFQTGTYRLMILQALPITSTSWWIENLSVKTYSVKWSARSHKSDAWNIEGDRWQDAGFTLNSLNGGLVFDEIGNGLQIRAQALRQDASIADFKAIPQYATLGRLIYRDEVPVHTQPEPKLKITTSISERVVQFMASQESSVNIVAYYWSFGDETEDSGLSVSHTYAGPGIYVVTLTAQTNEGQSTSIQKSVTIS